ncbi:unnamed protein product [Schistosoma curassoni]|uniref:Retrovirus-related Pol polyprotein from transposon TNT 1-94 n=1 Tax=Schistosoma curassoni TaxID=6186 RepID=A0A183L3L4_9TREM|nr:unnamed protein product [Schistosoma curassoni]
MEELDIHSTPEALEDYLERFEIWSMTKKDVKGDKIVAHFLTFIGKEAYSLLKTLSYPEKPISLPYATLKELLLSHVKCTSFECRERAKFRQNDQKAQELILELQKQAAYCNFGDQLHSCNSDSTESSIHDDHLYLSTISKDTAKSYGSSELNEIPNSCKTTVPNQPIYQNSHAIVPSMTFPNDSYISNKTTCISEENMLNERIHDRKPDVVWIDADFSNDPTLCNDSLNEFHENISEEPNPDVISYITYPHNAFDPCEKPAQCASRVLSDLEFDYISDDFISTAVYPYHKNSSNVYSKKCEKYVLNKVTLFTTWGYKDPTLFCGGG